MGNGQRVTDGKQHGYVLTTGTTPPHLRIIVSVMWDDGHISNVLTSALSKGDAAHVRGDDERQGGKELHPSGYVRLR